MSTEAYPERQLMSTVPSTPRRAVACSWLFVVLFVVVIVGCVL